ncbi:MAG: hypothetical protein U0324_29800 [Polyangiales bacterium]
MVVGDLDVVARLDDHQQNVPAPPPRAPSRVVCLPPPPVERALGVDAAMDDVRRARCEALATRVGGGDGAAPVELLLGEGALIDALDRWAREGVAMLHVVGGRAQPGWARALLARWGEGLRFEEGEDDALDAAFDDAVATLRARAASIPRSPSLARFPLPPAQEAPGEGVASPPVTRHAPVARTRCSLASGLRAYLMHQSPFPWRFLRRGKKRARLGERGMEAGRAPRVFTTRPRVPGEDSSPTRPASPAPVRCGMRASRAGKPSGTPRRCALPFSATTPRSKPRSASPSPARSSTGR